MARLGPQGFVDDGSSSLTVGGDVSVGGASSIGHGKFNAVTVSGSGSVTFATPGFYNISAGGTAGAGDFTGSVPSPASFPGSMLIIKDSLGSFPFLLTGSSLEPGRGLFHKMSGSANADPAKATLGGMQVSVSPKGSIVLVSDSIHWCIMAGSGSYTLAGNNA